ncbi:MAG TPA: hypothetical protein VFR11_03855 [Micromonosporaceae bacterium]|jgi:hypothetical protein|nr:hypothetical protein [Micromonosporaceae bacterium]
MNVLQIVIVAAVVVWMIVRRFAGSPVQAKSLVAPLALTAYGIIALNQGMHGHFTGADDAMLALDAVAGLLAGLARGATIKLYVRDGHLWQRYTIVTLGVWLAFIAARVGIAASGNVIGAALPVGGSIIAAFGVSMLVESFVVQQRAASTGTPIAPATRRVRSMIGSR